MFVIETTNMNMNTKIQVNTLAGAACAMLCQTQPRWLVWLTGGVGLAVLVKVALVAAQIFAILDATYAADLT
jgi:hypothetical protein